MRFSRRGRKDNRARLVWSKYYNYKLENKDHYIKQKAYTTHCDGWIDAENITERTYKNAVNRGNDCKEIVVEEDIMSASLDALALIFGKEYGISKNDARESILKAKAAIEKIRKDSKMSMDTEYKIFKRVLDCHINLTIEDPEHIAI